MKPLEFHEAANIFPLDEEHIGELADDIKANKQQVDIELFDGKILDGRRRYLACQKAKVMPKFKDVSPADPVAYVLSLNLHRRHLSATQLSMVGARAKDVYSEQAKQRQKDHGGTAPGKSRNTGGNSTTSDSGKARDLAGKAVGVSGSLIDRASKVIEHGVSELIKAVDEDRMSVSTAAERDRPGTQTFPDLHFLAQRLDHVQHCIRGREAIQSKQHVTRVKPDNLVGSRDRFR